MTTTARKLFPTEPYLVRLNMLRLTLICFFMVTAQVVVAQRRPAQLEQANYFAVSRAVPVLTGEIQNLPDSLKGTNDLLEVTFYTLDCEGKTELTVPVEHDGTFKIEIPYELALQQVYLSVNSDTVLRLYLEKGLKIKIDFPRLNTATNGAVTFSGPDATLNAELAAYYKLRERYHHNSRLDEHMRNLVDKKLDATTFLMKIALLQGQIEGFNKSFFKSSSRNRYQWLATNESTALYYANILEFFWINRLTLPKGLSQRMTSFRPAFLGNAADLFYHYLHYYATNEWEKTQQLPLDSILYAVLKGHLIKKKTTVLLLRRTASLYAKYNRLKMAGLDVSTEERLLNKRLSIVNQHFFPYLKPHIDSWAKVHSISLWDYLLKMFPVKRADILLARSLPRAAQLPPSKFNEEYRKVIPLIQSPDVLFFVNSYAKKSDEMPLDVMQIAAEESTGDGGRYDLHQFKVGPDIQLYYNLSISGLEMIKQLQESNVGKVLLLDFWATWCSPCFEDFEQAKKLKVKMNTAQLLFVYLCNDSKIEDWKERIVEKHITGIHLYLNGKQSKEIMSRFHLSGYPSYLLIAGNGDLHYDVRWVIHDPDKGLPYLNRLLADIKPK